VELIPQGNKVPVTFENSLKYAQLLEDYRLHEFSRQVGALCRGLASIVPFNFFSIFTAKQLEILITGNPDIDIDLLREKTEYRGSVTPNDRHIKLFWQVMKNFSQEDRKRFLQFVWGRNRLPSNSVGFGRELFKISDHSQAIFSRDPDRYLPISHTCFFAFELPRYTTEHVMREKILYAINNCTTVDGDATHEGRANLQMSSNENEE